MSLKLRRICHQIVITRVARLLDFLDHTVVIKGAGNRSDFSSKLPLLSSRMKRQMGLWPPSVLASENKIYEEQQLPNTKIENSAVKSHHITLLHEF